MESEDSCNARQTSFLTSPVIYFLLFLDLRAKGVNPGEEETFSPKNWFTFALLFRLASKVAKLGPGVDVSPIR